MTDAVLLSSWKDIQIQILKPGDSKEEFQKADELIENYTISAGKATQFLRKVLEICPGIVNQKDIQALEKEITENSNRYLKLQEYFSKINLTPIQKSPEVRKKLDLLCTPIPEELRQQLSKAPSK